MATTYKVRVVNTRPMTVAYIIQKGPPDYIPDTFTRLYRWIDEQGYRPCGPAIAVFHTIPGQVSDDQLLWELRSALSGNIAEYGPDEHSLGVKQVGAVQVAAIRHRGPYETTEETFNILMDWLSKSDYEISGPFEELYYDEPDEKKTEGPLTEIRFQIRRKQGLD
jgi:effector-binding domain-containing protein